MRIFINNEKDNKYIGLSNIFFGTIDDEEMKMDNVNVELFVPSGERDYEDVIVRNRKHGTILIDTKFSSSKGGIGSGNLISNDIAIKNFNRPLFYFICKYNNSEGKFDKVIIINNYEIDLSNRRFYKTQQYTLGSVKLKDTKISGRSNIFDMLNSYSSWLDTQNIDDIEKEIKIKRVLDKIDNGIKGKPLMEFIQLQEGIPSPFIDIPKNVNLVKNMKDLPSPNTHLARLLLSYDLSNNQLLLNIVSDYDNIQKRMKSLIDVELNNI